MKKLASYAIILITILFTSVKASAQNANTSLSNLAAPTKVNVTLLPDKDKARNLGSVAKAWKNIYLDSAVYFRGERFLADQSGTGVYNTAVGASSLISNTSGSYNTANGFFALLSNTTGSDNSANGHWALYSNTSGTDNTADGMFAMVYTNGSYNTALGKSAMYYNTSGAYNTAVGYNALYNTTTSQFNTAVGFNAGDSYDNGFNNIFVGANVDVNGTGYYNDIAIGQGTVCTDVSQVTMGNGATSTYRAYANWSNISDGRFKKNIKENVPGLAFINKLQPITYTLDATGIDNFLHADQPQDKQISGQAKAFMSKALAEKEKVTYTGFIAQDVEKAAKSLSYNFSGVDAAKNSKDLYGLRYAEFVVPLVKAVQELTKLNDDKDSAIQNLQNQINELKAMMVSNQAMMNAANQSSFSSQLSAKVSSDALQQNFPNPFTNSTTINYSLPQQYSSAQIIITDNKGVALKQINLNAKGKGSVQVDASVLSFGAYQYTLYVDGKLIDTKQMMLTK